MSTRHHPCPPANDGGQGVGRLLHHTRRRGGVRCLLHREEERRSTLPTLPYASSPPCNGAPSSSILRVGCILHRKDEEYAAYISPSRGGEEDYTTHSYSCSSSPPCDEVRYLLIVQMRIRSRTPTPSIRGEGVLCFLLLTGVRQ